MLQLAAAKSKLGATLRALKYRVGQALLVWPHAAMPGEVTIRHEHLPQLWSPFAVSPLEPRRLITH